MPSLWWFWIISGFAQKNLNLYKMQVYRAVNLLGVSWKVVYKLTNNSNRHLCIELFFFRQWNSLKWDENCKLLNGSIWQFVFVPPKVPDSALWWLTFGESSSARILKRREGGLLWTIFCKHWVQHSWFSLKIGRKLMWKQFFSPENFIVNSNQFNVPNPPQFYCLKLSK